MKFMPVRNPHAILTALFVVVKTCFALVFFFSDDKATRVLGGCAFIGGVVFIATASRVVRHVSRSGVWVMPDNYGLLRGFLVIDLVLNGVFFWLSQTLAAWPVLVTIVVCDLLALVQLAAGKAEPTYPRGL